jgi:transcriptional regulator with XRE-family HTH domain
MDQNKIGNFIKSIRIENNLTQKDFADKLGVTPQAVSKWENGKNIPDIAIMKDISEKFQVNIDEILNGEKIYQKKSFPWMKLIPVFIVVLVLIIVFIIINTPKDFEFKTITSKCSDFKITGSAAYNKDKAAIYISNIEFCGKEDTENYQSITCKLYEENNKTKTELSECEEKNNSSLEEFLKDVNINVNNYSSICKNKSTTKLVLEINATTENNKTITYTIPLKLNDNCK